MSPVFRSLLTRSLPLVAVALLTGCAIAKPRTDDPHEKFNRSVYAFNNSVDKAVVRPVAMGYRKVTTEGMRRSVSDFFTNIRLPITVANDLLQARPKEAVQSSGRFIVNLTFGLGGLFDPASELGIPLNETDFGVTLARWGVPEGSFLMLPFLGPTTMRDVWRIPVDGYFFDPLSYFARNNSYEYGQEYLPQVLYLISLRSSAVDAESFLNSAYDPYAFLRDAFRQQRLYMIYRGNPPEDVIEQMQGLKDKNFNPDELLEEQQKWQNQQPTEKPTQNPPKQQ
ncbi:VacJ family lipoprotein [Dyella halodurans]|uniref:VacJ family lipoprotein n=1 Tax=Dyella halodurans TaxID=1920171 RepID=A0ABV9C7I9_9GAMM|nr:VacJ family lipoprotein [Dyella halodurans]